MNKHERSINKDLLKEAMMKFNISEEDLMSAKWINKTGIDYSK